MNPRHSLAIASVAERGSIPEQRRFNKLVQQIDKARDELALWESHSALFARGVAERIDPLHAELFNCQQQMLDVLERLRNAKGLTPRERGTLNRVLGELAGNLAEHPLADAVLTARCKVIYQRTTGVNYDQETRDAAFETKQMFEAVTGIKLGDDDLDSPEALMARLQEQLEQADAKEAERQARRAAKSAEKNAAKPPSAAARKRQAKAEQAAQQAKDASGSLREVFRKLASALHPDRAGDAADLQRRTALMSRVNQAYSSGDLLGLLSLQLEIEQIDAEHLAQASAEKLRHYNHVLAEQLDELKAELEAREVAFLMEHQLDPYERIRPSQLGRLLDDQVKDLRMMLAQAQGDLTQVVNPSGLKHWLKVMRREHQAIDAEDDFPFP